MDDVVALLVAQAPLVAVAVAILYWKMDVHFRKIEASLRALSKFGEKLLYVLGAREVASDVEVELLRGYLELPTSRSKYYTKEVEARLRELLSKRVSDYTREDLLEMRRIAKLIEREAEETRDRRYAEELRDFLVDFRLFLAVLEGRLAAREKAARAV